MAERHEERRTEALDLQRTRRLPVQARPDAVGREQDEGQEDGGDHERHRPVPTSRARAGSTRRVRAARDERPELRGHRRTEQGPAEPVALGEQRDDRGGREQRRPEVEAAEDQRARQHRRERDEERGCGPDTSDHEHERDAAGRHQPREGAGVVAEGRRCDERRQRARRVLDREVAIRNAAVVQDRVPVVAVGRPVDELAVRPEPPVDEPEAGEEQAACGERLSRGQEPARQRPRPLRLPRPARLPAAAPISASAMNGKNHGR